MGVVTTIWHRPAHPPATISRLTGMDLGKLHGGGHDYLAQTCAPTSNHLTAHRDGSWEAPWGWSRLFGTDLRTHQQPSHGSQGWILGSSMGVVTTIWHRPAHPPATISRLTGRDPSGLVNLCRKKSFAAN